jgi:hypothetical protein
MKRILLPLAALLFFAACAPCMVKQTGPKASDPIVMVPGPCKPWFGPPAGVTDGLERWTPNP